MAKILRKHFINTVKSSYYKTLLLLALCWAAAVFCAVCALFTYAISLIFLIPISVLIYRLFHRSRSLKSGADGEKSCLKLLSKLPKGFYVIPDVTLNVKNKTAQLDYIVISRSGVFIVESKNHGGVISGSLLEPRLYKTKHINGKKETRDFYNPAYQVSTHIRLMRELLNDQNFNANIFGAVYFSNPRTILELDTSLGSVPVFSFKQR
ncbi:MAG: nuclease-related domain-containing protein, partial [Oscillospiraceae bacterium]|nr:nuclease-related domain-containing protein [Oscillospiraceae bacterium]